MTIEKDIEQYLVQEVEKIGGLCWKFTSPGNAGVPDRIVIYGGQVVFVEVKAPGKKPRKLQLKRIQELRNEKVLAEIIESKSKVNWLVGKLERGDADVNS